MFFSRMNFASWVDRPDCVLWSSIVITFFVFLIEFSMFVSNFFIEFTAISSIDADWFVSFSSVIAFNASYTIAPVATTVMCSPFLIVSVFPYVYS